MVTERVLLIEDDTRLADCLCSRRVHVNPPTINPGCHLFPCRRSQESGQGSSPLRRVLLKLGVVVAVALPQHVRGHPKESGGLLQRTLCFLLPSIHVATVWRTAMLRNGGHPEPQQQPHHVLF